MSFELYIFYYLYVISPLLFFQIVLLLRLVPLLPFNLLNYLLSVTPVNLGSYILATWLGMMVMYSALSDLVLLLFPFNFLS